MAAKILYTKSGDTLLGCSCGLNSLDLKFLSGYFFPLSHVHIYCPLCMYKKCQNTIGWSHKLKLAQWYSSKANLGFICFLSLGCREIVYAMKNPLGWHMRSSTLRADTMSSIIWIFKTNYYMDPLRNKTIDGSGIKSTPGKQAKEGCLVVCKLVYLVLYSESRDYIFIWKKIYGSNVAQSCVINGIFLLHWKGECLL